MAIYPGEMYFKNTFFLEKHFLDTIEFPRYLEAREVADLRTFYLIRTFIYRAVVSQREISK